MEPDAILDPGSIRKAFDRAAADFDQQDFLHTEIRDRLLDRLELIQMDAKNILDLGSGTLGAAKPLHDRYPQADITAVDFSSKMLHAGIARHEFAQPICADAEKLPIASTSQDLIFSNLMLHCCADLPAVLTEARRVLRFPGVFCFTTLGPDTLIELRAAWQGHDTFSHVLPLMDMHNLGDLLVSCGFAEPVVDREVITVTYQSVERLMADLRAAGSINAGRARNPGLTGARAWRQMAQSLESARGDDGRFPITLELIYGKAWSGEPARGFKSVDGQINIPVDTLRSRRR